MREALILVVISSANCQDIMLGDYRKPVKTQILSSHTFEYLWEVFARVVRRDSHTAGVTWPCSSNGTGGTGCLLSRYWRTNSKPVASLDFHHTTYQDDVACIPLWGGICRGVCSVHYYQVRLSSCTNFVRVTASGHSWRKRKEETKLLNQQNRSCRRGEGPPGKDKENERKRLGHKEKGRKKGSFRSIKRLL